jgi:hypothetical protein
MTMFNNFNLKNAANHILPRFFARFQALFNLLVP